MPASPLPPYDGDALAGLVLRNRAIAGSPPWLNGLIIASFVIVGAVAALVIAARVSDLESLGRLAAQHPLEALGVVTSLTLTPLSMWLMTRERVVLGGDAVHYRSSLELPWNRSWTLHLHELEFVTLEPVAWIPSPIFWKLVLHGRSATRALRVFQWVDPETYDTKAYDALQDFRNREAEVHALLADMPLVAWLVRAGHSVEAPQLATPSASERETHPGVGAAVFAMLGAIVYGLVDATLLTETYAQTPPWAWIVGIGALSGGLAFAALSLARLARSKALALGLLVGIAFGFAAFPGLLRLNAALDPEPPQPHRYVHGSDGHVHPVVSTSPELDLPYLLENFPASEPGTEYELWLRQGPLGWPQLDLLAFERSVAEARRHAAAGD